MKKILVVTLSIMTSTGVFASNQGKEVYQMACQNCHSPKLAEGLNAPAAFDRKAWQARFTKAEEEAKKNPSRYKSAMDYLLSEVKIGKGLMAHGGLCKEANVANKNCSDEALIDAINYMSHQGM